MLIVVAPRTAHADRAQNTDSCVRSIVLFPRAHVRIACRKPHWQRRDHPSVLVVWQSPYVPLPSAHVPCELSL
jgi:hypothetical protein